MSSQNIATDKKINKKECSKKVPEFSGNVPPLLTSQLPDLSTSFLTSQVPDLSTSQQNSVSKDHSYFIQQPVLLNMSQTNEPNVSVGDDVKIVIQKKERKSRKSKLVSDTKTEPTNPSQSQIDQDNIFNLTASSEVQDESNPSGLIIEDEETCPVCMETFGDKKTSTGDNCNHKFCCGECWDGVIARQNRCPICRKKLINQGWKPVLLDDDQDIMEPSPAPRVLTAEEIELAEFEAEEEERAERRRQLERRVQERNMMSEVVAIRQRKLLSIQLRRQQALERHRLELLTFAQEEEQVRAITDEALIQEELASRAIQRIETTTTRTRNIVRRNRPTSSTTEEPPRLRMDYASHLPPTGLGRGRAGNGNRSRLRTTEAMDIKVDDVLVMTLQGQTWRVVCRNAEHFGKFQITEASNRPELVGKQYDRGSPINNIFQELVESVGLARQSRAPWKTYTKKWRNGENLGGLDWA